MGSTLPTVPAGMLTRPPTDGCGVALLMLPVVVLFLSFPESWNAARVASATTAQPPTASTPRRRQTGGLRCSGAGDQEGPVSRGSEPPTAFAAGTGLALRVRGGTGTVGSDSSSRSLGSARIASDSSLTVVNASCSPRPRARQTVASTCLGTAARICAGVYSVAPSTGAVSSPYSATVPGQRAVSAAYQI